MHYALVQLLTCGLEIIRSSNRDGGFKNSEMQNKLIDLVNRMGATSSFDEKWNCLTDSLFDLGSNVVNYTVFSAVSSPRLFLGNILFKPKIGSLY